MGENFTKTIEMSASVQTSLTAPASGVLIGYAEYPDPAYIITKMKIDWHGVPAGGTLYVQHGGSDGGKVLAWDGPDSSNESAGTLSFSVAVERTAGSSVPLYIYAFADDYVPFNLTIEATNVSVP